MNNTAPIIISARQVDAMIQISVRDHGTGIPPEMAEAIYQPFRSSKATGMGMGLAVCRRIIEAHGGRLWFENNADAGATFHFTLPRADFHQS